MPRAKRLTMNELTKQNKAFDQRKKVLLLGKYEEYIDVRFRKRKMQQLLKDYLTILSDARLTEQSGASAIDESFVLLYTLIVRHFSSIELPPIGQLEQLIVVSNALFDLGLLDELFGDGENAFDQGELRKLTAELTKGIAALGDTFAGLLPAILQERSATE